MRLPILFAAALALSAAEAQADTLQIPSDAQGQGSYREMPRRGMSMGQVERRFGAPARKLAPVGRPPIARWVYDGFTVYFERTHVVEAVKNGPAGAAAEAGTAPVEKQLWFSDDPVLEHGRHHKRHR